MERVRELAQHYNEDAVIGNFTNKPPKKQKITKAKMRNVEWIHYHKYTQVKAGIPMETEAQIKLLFENKEINEDHLYIFRNNDPAVQRNIVMPLYEAVYWCNERKQWLIVQKSHLKIAYKNAGKTARSSMWNMDSINVPYWVDRYAFCVNRIMESQKK
jgi:ATP-dependent Zn protease